MRQVVDIFRSASEVDELTDGANLRIAIESFLQPIFQGFDIMICARLNGFDLCCFSLAKSVDSLS